MIHFEPVDPGNWRLNLQITEEQKRHVADCTTILARAFAYRDSRSQAYVIYDGDIPVGMVMYHDCEELDAYVFSELLIDKDHQGKGYGTAATRLALDRMKQDGKYSNVILCYIEGNVAAKHLYERFGFRETDRDEDEIIMELHF